jgi:hypothetical protein
MNVDVATETIIARPREVVSAFAADPDRVTAWYRNISCRVADGPFPMETTYTWEDAGQGRTRMRLRNSGTPAGFSVWLAPLMGRAMRRANRKDLATLKAVLES